MVTHAVTSKSNLSFEMNLFMCSYVLFMFSCGERHLFFAVHLNNSYILHGTQLVVNAIAVVIDQLYATGNSHCNTYQREDNSLFKSLNMTKK